MRNVTVHDYGRVELETVWDAATLHLPIQAAQLSRENTEG